MYPVNSKSASDFWWLENILTCSMIQISIQCNNDFNKQHEFFVYYKGETSKLEFGIKDQIKICNNNKNS